MADFLDTMVIPRLKEGGQLSRQYRLGELIQLVMERIPIDTVYAAIPHQDGYGFHVREIGVISVSIVPTNHEILKDKIDFNAPRPQPVEFVAPPTATHKDEPPIADEVLGNQVTPIAPEFNDPIPEEPVKRGRGRPKGSTKKPAITPLPEPQRIAGPGQITVQSVSSDSSDKYSRFGERP
jgi:hypothetical protein